MSVSKEIISSYSLMLYLVTPCPSCQPTWPLVFLPFFLIFPLAFLTLAVGTHVWQ